MSTKLIVLLTVGALVLITLACMLVRAWRYRRNHPEETYWPFNGGLNAKIMIVTVLLTFLFCGNSVFAQGGHGAPNNPYRIRKANELVAFANCLSTGNEFYFYKYGYSKEYICSPTPPSYGDYDTIPAYGEGKYFLIPNDITLNQGNLAACDGEIDPAWTVWPETVVFKGHLLGDKHTISGMYIERPDNAVGVGFFSKMEGDAHIEKLGIVNSYIKGGASNIGGLVGELSGGHINNCFFEGSIRTSGDNVGGLVGLMTAYNDATAGTQSPTMLPEVSVCFASGHVDCTGDYVAGLVGKVEKGTVRQSYSSMIVRTTDMVGTALSGANPTKGGIGTEEDIVNQHIGGIYGYALSPYGSNSYDPDVDSIRVDTCYFDWQLSDLPSIPGSSWVPADWRNNRGAAALSTYDMTYYSMMYFDIKNQKPSLWKNTYLCNVYPYPDPFNDPINVTYRLELDYPQDSIVTATLVPFLDVFMKPNGNGQSTINNMNDQERKHMKLSDLTESFVLWKGCDSLDITWTLDSLWPDAVRREFYAPDNSWNVYLQKQGVVRLTVKVAGRTRYYDAVVNIPPYVGSAENPFLISNLEDFLAFRDGINANEDFIYHRFLIPRDSLPHIHWIQTADIDLASVGDWVSIGKNADTCFTGFYDGRGHKLMNLTMTNGTDRALFVYSKGEISNLVLEDPHITGCRGSSAALATNVKGGSFENCAVTYSAESNNHSPLQFVGSQCAALIGSVEMGNEPHTSIHITGCFNSCDIANYLNGGYAAGLVGYVNADTCILERCFNTGDISVVSGVVHPLVGHSRSTTRRIYTDCYNAGVLTGNQVEVESANTTFYNDYHVNPVCEGATKVATRYFIGPEALVREHMGDDFWLYEDGLYPRPRWTDTLAIRSNAIAACTPRLALDSLPLPDTMTVDNFHDLNNLRNIVNGNSMVIYKDYLLPHYVQDIVFSLTNDVNLSDITSNWIPIGTKRFAGTFLGNNHTLNQLSSTRSVVGLFGTLTGKVYDLNITVNTITGADTAGAVCAILNGGRIENCSVKKYNNTSDNLYGVTVGGIAGVSLTANDSIVGCFNYVDVIGTHCVGGLIAEGGNVRNSANAGDVTGKADCPYIGGISGRNTNVVSSLNTGIITALPGNSYADNYVGGLVGKIENGELRIENCYNAGIVNGENRKYVGGICGAIDGSITNNQSPIIQNCYVSNTVRSTGTHLGSIVGSILNYQLSIINCCYDNQMSPAGGIDGSDQAGTAEGMPTANTMGTGDNDFYNTFWGENASTNIWYYSDNYYPQLQGIRNLNTTFSNASAMRAQLYDQETYNTVSHQFTLNYADVGSWQRVGGSNCVSIGTTPSNNLITVTIPSTNNHPAQGYITLGFRGPSTNDPVYRKVQLWVNLSEENPIIIRDADELKKFRTIINQGSGYYRITDQTFLTSTPNNSSASQYVRITDGGRNLYFKLTADVDLAFHGTTSSGQQYNVLDLWTSIGTQNRPFLGHFDGGNRTVKNFLIPGDDNQGFFGYIDGGTVKNLTIAGAITNHNTTGDHRGILCGYNNSGTIRNCFITQDVGSNYHSPSRLSAVTGRNLGFICGTNHYGRIVRCQTDMTQIENATYTHGSSFGGICGYNDFGTIDSCRSHLSINPGVTIDTVGGIVGYNHNGILVADTSYNNSYNKSIMSYVGCIAGYSNGTQSEIRSCYVDEQSRIPSHGNYIGGVVGKMDNGIIDGCEHLGTIIAEGNYIGGIAGLCVKGVLINGCFNAGTVGETKINDYVGGIVGSLTDSSSISACFNSGLVTGRYFVGGLIGHMSEACHFTDCYNTGIVKGISQVGGIVGLQQNPTVSSGYGYSAGWVEGSSMVGAVCGYTSATTMLHNLHYDQQMCSYKGVNEEDVTGVTAHSTSEMMGVTFGGDRPWMYGESMYPRLSNISNTDASKVSALALQIGDIYNLSYTPNTSYTLPSYTPASGTFTWSKFKSSDKAATLSGTTLTASGTRDFMRIKATKSIFSNGENHTIPLRTVLLSFGISEQQPLIVNSVGFLQLRNYINEGQPFYYSNGAFYASSQILTDAIPIPADADGIHFKLNADVDYTANNWVPIGTEEHPFRGYLDGGGHTVHVSFINTSEDFDFWGLFGYLQGRVKNLFLYDVSISADNRVGALAGFCNGTVSHCGTLSNCSSAPVVQGQTAVGGLIGEAFLSQIFDCYNGSNVRGKQSVGGIVGNIGAIDYSSIQYSNIISSFNYGMVSATGDDSRVGGIAGSIQNSEFKIQNCYNTGAINGKTNVAGITGAVLNSKFTILNSYNAGFVSGDALVEPFAGTILNSPFSMFNCYYDRQLCPLDADDTTARLTTEMIGDGLKAHLGEDSWIYNDHEYPHLKAYDSTMAARVSVKPIYLTGRMLMNSIVADFMADTTSGVKWYRYGTGTALNEPNPDTANGSFTLNNCGEDSLMVVLTDGNVCARRVVPLNVAAANIKVDTILACSAYTWKPTNDHTEILDKPGFYSYSPEGEDCDSTKAIELFFSTPLETTIDKQDACMDSYWSKYGHNIGFLKATVLGGGFSTEHTVTEYTYEWSRANGTIDNESFIAGHPDSLRYLSSDTYYLTTTDINAPLCQTHDTILVDEYSFNYLVTKWGNCVNADDGWIELVIRQYEFNRDGSPYSIMYWDSNHTVISEHTIPALNPPDESGVPKGYDTLFNLANGLYYMTITDRLGCYQDKQIKVNDPINPKMTLRANGFKKVYDGTPVSPNNINRINVVEYDDNWKVPERAEYYITSDKWRQLALRIGDSLIVSLSNPNMMIKDVDSVRNKIVGWSIKDAETGKDKTCLYHFYPIDSCIVIVPATLTLFTGSATKEYDGTELTNYTWNVQGLQNNEHVWCMPSASLTDVGSIENICEIDWGNPGPWGENVAQQKNYTVINHFGTLTVTPNTQPITLTAKSASKKYDGIALTNDTVVATGLPNGFYVEATTSGSQTNIGTSTNVVNSYVIKNADGETKTEYFTNVTTVAGTLTVEPAELFITTPSATKSYDGSALTAAFDPSTGAGSISGLASNESITVTTTGSQTDVGESDNSYTIDWGTINPNNYLIHDNLGTLTVTPAPVTVTADNISKTYSENDPQLTASVIGAAAGDAIAYTLSRSAGETVGTYPITVTLGNNPNYEVIAIPGTFTINKKAATVVVDNKSKTYGDTDPELTAAVEGTVGSDAIAYTLSREAGETTGTYPITVTLGNNPNYEVTPTNGTFTIARATATVKADNKEKVAGSTTDPTLTATVSGLRNNDAASVINYTLSRENGQEVGTYAITPTGDDVQGNYNVTYLPGTFTITPQNEVVVRIVGHNNTAVYDKTEHVVNGYDVISISNPNYTAADFDFTGTAEARRTNTDTTYMGLAANLFTNNNSNYAVTFLVTDGYQAITPAPATVVANNNSKTYGEADPTLSATVAGTVEGDAIAFSLARTAGENAGTYPITVTLGSNPNYQVTATNGTFTITRAALTVKADNKDKTFGATDPELTATITGLQNNDAANVVSYTLNREAGENVGTYTITPAGSAVQGNYNVTYETGTLTITSADAVVVTITGQRDTAVYNGLEHSVRGYDVTINNPLYTENDFTFSGIDTAVRTDVGISIMGLNSNQFSNTSTNFNQVNFIVKDGWQMVTKAPATVKADMLSKIYGNVDPELTATVSGIAQGDSIAFTLSREPGETVGTYAINVTLDDNDSQNKNYQLSAINAQLSIIPRAATVLADNLGKTYGESDPTLTATITGYVENDTIAYSLFRTPGDTVGTYPITVTLGSNPNYEVTATNGTFSINKKAATVVADSLGKTYGETDPTLTATVTGSIGNDTIAYSLSRAAGENAGFYTITVTLGNNPNYEVTATNGIFFIDKKIAQVTANNSSKIYGNADPEFTATVTDTLAGDTLNYTLVRSDGENVGSYSITVNLGTNPNYEVIRSNGVFTIEKKAVSVTASDKSKIYGSTDPELSATVTGSLGNDVINYTLSRAAGENVGTYPITVTPGSNPNYEVTTTSGTFTINKKAAIVVATNKNKYYGTADPALTATVTGTVGNDALNYTLARETGENVGLYPITATLGNNPNYEVTTSPGVFTIDPATAMVMADNKEKVHYAIDPALTATVAGLKNGEPASLISYTMSREAGEDVGTYTIYPSGAARQGNYNVTYLPGVLTIVNDTLIIAGTLNNLTVYGCSASDATPYTTVAELEAAGLTIQSDCPISSDIHVSNNDLNIGTDCPTMIRTYTIADDCGHSVTTSQTIYITHNEAPHEMNGPVPTSSEVHCYVSDVIPPHENTNIIMPTVMDSCGNVLDFGTPTVSNNYSLTTCSGDFTYNYTYTDCAGKVFQWNYTYHVLPPTLSFTAPNNIAVCRNTDGSYTITPNVTGTVQNVSATCSTLDTTYSDATPVQNQDGTLTIVRTWTVSDTCQNTIQKQQVITVNPLPSLTVTPISQEITYGDNITPVVIGNSYSTITLSALPAGLTYNSNTQTISGTPAAAGNFTITATASSNLTPGCGTAEQEISIKVNPKSLTITALNQTYVHDGNPHGENNITYTNATDIASKVSISGLVGSDQLTSITLNGQETNIGVYPNTIVPSAAVVGNATANYDITYTGGTLTITEATLTVTGTLENLTVSGCTAADAPVAFTTVAQLEAAGLTIQGNCTVGNGLQVSSNDVSTGTCPTVTRTYTIADDCGHSVTTSQTIYITHNEAPHEMNGPVPTSSEVHCYVSDVIPPHENTNIIMPTVVDSCGNVLDFGTPTVSNNYSSTTCSGDFTYNYTYTDCAGKVFQWYYTYHVLPATLSFTDNGLSDVTLNNTCYSENVTSHLKTNADVWNMYSTDCNALYLISVTSEDTIVSASNCSWKVTRTFTITNGCTTEIRKQSVSGGNTTAPTFTAPDNVTLCRNTDLSYTITPDVTGTVQNVSATCSTVDTTYSDAAPVQNQDGSLTIVRTWTVSDTCQNTIQKQQVITVNPLPSLTVTPISQEITYGDNITPVLIGNSYSTITLSALPAGLSYNSTSQTISGTPAAAGNFTITATASSNQTPGCGTAEQVISIKVNPKPLTITALNQTYTHDGNPHGEDNITYTNAVDIASKVSVSGLVGNDQLTSITLDGQETHVGIYPNTIVPSAAVVGNSTNNYDISYVSGTLTIGLEPVEVTITGRTAIITYDGNEHNVTGYTMSIPAGVSLTENDIIGPTTAIAQGTNVKTENDSRYMMGLTSEQFGSINPNYAVTFVVNDGWLDITPRSVTLTSATDQKVYDGTSLTNSNVTVSGEGFVEGEGANYVVTGSQMLVGSSENSFSYTMNSNTMASNYDISTIYGVLTVTDGTDPSNPNPVNDRLVVTKDVVSVPENGEKFKRGEEVTFSITATNIYDEPKTITLTEIAGVTLAQRTFMNVPAGETITTTATYTITAADVLRNHFTNTVTASVGNLIKFAEATVETVLAPTIVITSGDRDFHYDGFAHSYPSYKIEYDGVNMAHLADDSTRFVLPYGDTLSVINPPSITYISDNTLQNNSFAYTLDHENNYDLSRVTLVFGTISISPNPSVITITAGSSQKPYDGTPLVDSSYTYTPVDVLAPGDTIVVQIEGSITEIGQTDNVVVGYTVYRNENYNGSRTRNGLRSIPAGYTMDVTNCYTFNNEMVNGTLTILCDPITLANSTFTCPENINDTIRHGGCNLLITDIGTPNFTTTSSVPMSEITISNNAPADNIYPAGETVVKWVVKGMCNDSIICEQIIKINFMTCPDAVDFEDNLYPSVRLGNDCKCWMAKNLKSTQYSDGRTINNVMDYQTAGNTNMTPNVDIFGHLYDWYAAADTQRYGSVDSVERAYTLGHHIQGICPEGWYLPTDEDFEDLNAYTTSELRSANYWINADGEVNANSTGFNAVPSGMYNCATDRYENVMGNAYYWSCHPVFDLTTGAMIDYVCDKILSSQSPRCNGFSVRCILDEH